MFPVSLEELVSLEVQPMLTPSRSKQGDARNPSDVDAAGSINQQHALVFTNASEHSSVVGGTEFQRQDLAASAVKAHAAVLDEFRISRPGAAQLTREGPWFMLEEASVARSIETVAIVAILIATFSFTAFLQPPGAWTPQGTAVALNPTLGAGLESWFMAFAISNTVALAASMSLVMLIALGNSFGWKAQEMMWVLNTGFVLLAVAVLSAFAAFAAAAKVLSPNNTHLPNAVMAILCMAIATTVTLLCCLLVKVQAKARRDAYHARLTTLACVLQQLLDAVRVLNNSYITAESVPVGDVVLGHYFHCYAILMLASLMPLYRAFVTQVRQLRQTKPFWQEDLKEVEDVLSRLQFYWQLWVSNRGWQDLLPDVAWDVGVVSIEYVAGTAPQVTLPTIIGGSWPCIIDGVGNAVRPSFEELESTAATLVSQLLIAAPQHTSAAERRAHLSKYLGQVKCMFLWANLSPMMPYNVRTAVKQDLPRGQVGGSQGPGGDFGPWAPKRHAMPSSCQLRQ